MNRTPRTLEPHMVRANVRSLPNWLFCWKTLVIACLFLVGVVGYIDYLTGYERPLLLFYLLPVSLAAWFGSLPTALGIAVISIAVSLLSDVAAGIPALGFWNAGMAFVYYALFVGLFSKLRSLEGDLDRSDQERTYALLREVAESTRLDQAIGQLAA